MSKEAAHRKALRERGSRKVEEDRTQRIDKLRGWPGPGGHGGHAEEFSFFSRAVIATEGF